MKQALLKDFIGKVTKLEEPAEIKMYLIGPTTYCTMYKYMLRLLIY
jgi:hypothetical protein